MKKPNETAFAMQIGDGPLKNEDIQNHFAQRRKDAKKINELMQELKTLVCVCLNVAAINVSRILNLSAIISMAQAGW